MGTTPPSPPALPQRVGTAICLLHQGEGHGRALAPIAFGSPRPGVATSGLRWIVCLAALPFGTSRGPPKSLFVDRGAISLWQPKTPLDGSSGGCLSLQRPDGGQQGGFRPDFAGKWAGTPSETAGGRGSVETKAPPDVRSAGVILGNYSTARHAQRVRVGWYAICLPLPWLTSEKYRTLARRIGDWKWPPSS
jgi:hypothetical protein